MEINKYNANPPEILPRGCMLGKRVEPKENYQNHCKPTEDQGSCSHTSLRGRGSRPKFCFKTCQCCNKHALLSTGQGHMVNDSAMDVLKFSKGIVRVQLEDLGPALFNRQGAATSGQHCLQLAERILTLEGFATFRYVAGFCHEPDPDNPLGVARHGNLMQAHDTVLPRYPLKPLKGIFAKTHLVTFFCRYTRPACSPISNCRLRANRTWASARISHEALRSSKMSWTMVSSCRCFRGR